VGFTRMRAARLVIAGLGRSLGDLCAKNIRLVETIGSHFAGYAAIVCENDSDDATPVLLRSWARSNPRVTLFSQALGLVRYGHVRSLERARVLGRLRNQYHAAIAAKFSHYDYVMVIDLDVHDLDVSGVANTFGWGGWDVVGSNGVRFCARPYASGLDGFYCDSWAFRALGHPHPHRDREVHQISLERGDDLFPVLSSFGGAAVYTMPAFLSSQYAGTDCEHVPFHIAMRRRGYGRHFINPSQVVLYNSPPKRPFRVCQSI